MIAAAATTLALGSAAAYAITLPIQLPGLSLNVPIDLPSPLIAPPDTHLPDNPIVGSPDGNEADELAKDLSGILDPDALPNGAHAKDGPTPAKRSGPAPQKASGPAHAADKADSAKDLKEELKSLKDGDHDDLDDLKDLLSDEDWSKWAHGNPDGSISVTLGQGINVCNNNNVKVIVNRDSHDDSTTVEQHNSSNDVVTTVNGQHTDPSDSSAPNISCDH